MIIQFERAHLLRHSAGCGWKIISLLLLFFAFSASVRAELYWGEFKQDGCTQIFPGKRHYSAILNGIPWGESWEEACAGLGATINGETFERPTRCVNTGFNMWGEFDVSDATCEANWAAPVGTEYYTHQDDGCQTSGTYAGKHKYSSRLWNIEGMSWEAGCAITPLTLAGKTYPVPHECVNTGGATGMWGEWYVPDSRCENDPRPYERGVQDELKSSAVLPGFVDLHTHLMSHLGFGGVIFHGAPYGEADEALGVCPSGDDATHAEGHSRVESILRDDILGAVFGTSYHDNEGFERFTYWPAYNSFTHQTMYYEWVKRAYEGGMRAMVVLAVNGDYMFGAKDNGLPDIIKGIAIATNPELDLNDMETLRRQTEAVFAMQEWIDARNGGTGQGWFRVVSSPAEAREVIAAGKLAVILGSEVDYLLNCTADDCDPEQITEGVQALYDLGLRYIFPIHLKTNGFGGAAIYNLIAGGETYDCKHYSKDCNTQGLTDYGRQVLLALMKKGMMIDVGHMSAKALSETLQIAEQQTYPGIVTGHTGLYDMANLDNRHEANLRGTDLRRIIDLGGMIGLIPGQGNLDQVGEWRNADGTYIAHACGGTSQTFVQSYLYLKDLVGDRAYDGRISVGTDFNGFAHMPGPRFGDHACPGGSSGIEQPDSSRVVYPFAPDPQLRNPATAPGGVQLGRYQFGSRLFDYNTDGAAHIGLMPDFFEDLRQQGLKRSDLEPVYRSADYLTIMWQNAIDRSVDID